MEGLECYLEANEETEEQRTFSSVWKIWQWRKKVNCVSGARARGKMEAPRFGGHWPPPVMNLENPCFLLANRNKLQDVPGVLLNSASSSLRAKEIQQKLPPCLAPQEVKDALTELEAL
eukprot:2094009-Pyramimonas_sp.AAC.1